MKLLICGISLNFSGFGGSPGGPCSLLWGPSSSFGVSLVFGQMASLFVADEALAVPHVLCSFSGREIDSVYVHGIGIPRQSGGSSWLSQWDGAVSPTPELSELYHVSVELSCFVKPLFPFPASLFLSLWRASAIIMTASWLVTPCWRASTRMLLRSTPQHAWASLKVVAY